MDWWNRVKVKREEKPIESSKYDLVQMIEVGVKRGGLICVGDVVSDLYLRNRIRIGEVLGIGVTKEWLEIVAKKDEQGRPSGNRTPRRVASTRRT